MTSRVAIASGQEGGGTQKKLLLFPSKKKALKKDRKKRAASSQETPRKKRREADPAKRLPAELCRTGSSKLTLTSSQKERAAG